MLEQVLEHLHNYFVVPDGVHSGTYTVKDGKIDLPFLQNGQYFRFCGSVFNVGVHRYGADMTFTLTDETFDGVIWALAVPRAIIDLAQEIAAWNEKNAADTPFVSESFGGYSYSRATDGNGQPVGWQSAFRTRLNPYRKPREYGTVAEEARV